MTEPDPIDPPDDNGDHEKVRLLRREEQDLADAVTDYGDGDGEDDQPTGYVGVRLSVRDIAVKAFGPTVAAVHDVLNHAVTRKFVRELDRQRTDRRRVRGRNHAATRMRLSEAEQLLQSVAHVASDPALIRKIEAFLNRSDDLPT